MTTPPPVHLDADAAQRMAADDVTIDFTVTPALLPALVAWLDARGLDLMRVPLPEEADALPAYVVQPCAWRQAPQVLTGTTLDAVETALRTAHAAAGRPVGLDRVLINVEAHVQRPEVAAALRALTDAGRAWTHHHPDGGRTYAPAKPEDGAP